MAEAVARASGRRLLVVTYPFPPVPSVGGNRWLAMAKYLRRAGHDVHVLTTGAFGRLEGPAEHGILRTRDLAASPLVRGVFRRPPLPRPGEPAVVDTQPPALLTRVFVPDAYALSWVPFAIAAGRRAVRDLGIDVVITTVPYESTHLVGAALRREGCAWIADFRDGWTYEPTRAPFLTDVQRRLDARLEAALVRRADRVVAVHTQVADDFRDRLGVDAAYVPNGWDPELAPDDGDSREPIEPGRVTLVHTGTLGGGWGRDPRPLFEALSRLEPRVADRLRLVLVGRLTEEHQQILSGLRLGDLVRHEGQVRREQAIELQRRADALVLITSHRASEAPGKLFEYLGAGRPVLVLGSGNEASRIVEETGVGVAVPPRDVASIAAALERAADGGLDYAPRQLDRYVYPAPAEAMAAEVERAIAVRRG